MDLDFPADIGEGNGEEMNVVAGPPAQLRREFVKDFHQRELRQEMRKQLDGCSGFEVEEIRLMGPVDRATQAVLCIQEQVDHCQAEEVVQGDLHQERGHRCQAQ